MRALLISMMLLMALSACSSTQRAGLQCRPRSELHCLTPVACEMDRTLGCEVCRCSDVPYTPSSGGR